MPDLLDALVAAWLRWDASPKSEHTAHAKADAIVALGLDGNRLHDRVAALRRDGMDAESAVRRAAAEQGVEQ